jgi:hypothetical protein
LIASIIAATRLRNASDQKIRKFLLIFAAILLMFELYKQLIFSYQASWDYQWYAFPFQFCSTPMYVALFAGLTKNKKIQDALINFLGTYGLFAGLAVMLYPNDVFIETIGINIQTMVHHGAMAVVGVAMLSNRVNLKAKSIVSAALVFTVLVAMAIGMNFIHNTWIQDGTFNMFFINPLYNNHIPVLTLIEPLVPHFLFVIIYIVGFALVAFIMLLIGMGIKALGFKKTKEAYIHA